MAADLDAWQIAERVAVRTDDRAAECLGGSGDDQVVGAAGHDLGSDVGSRSVIDLEQRADIVEVLQPASVRSVPAQESLDIHTFSSGHRFKVGDRFASPNDREVLTAVLDGMGAAGWEHAQ